MSAFPNSSQLIGSIVDDRFEVLEKLGEGGMGAIYRARQVSMDRIVTLKILLRNLEGDPISAEQFRREAYLASRLKHPNTIVIHEFGQAKESGLLYIAMEYLDGRTLKERINLGSGDVKSTIKIIVQILKALSEAHRQGIVHRDIKPENIFLTEIDGDVDFVKVLDFGIAQLSNQNFNFERQRRGDQKQQTIGTPYYMSPEQIRGKQIDGQADIYSIGVLFYEMLVGNTPFHYNSAYEIMMAHLEEAPEPISRINPNVDPELDKLVLKALEKDRRLRYGSVDEFLKAIERYLAARNLSFSQPLQIIDDFNDEEDEDEATLISNANELVMSPELLAAAAVANDPGPADDEIPEGLFDDDVGFDDFEDEKTVLEDEDDFDYDDDESTVTAFPDEEHTAVGVTVDQASLMRGGSGDDPNSSLIDQSFNAEAIDFLFDKEDEEAAARFQPQAPPKIAFGQRPPAPDLDDDEQTLDLASANPSGQGAGFVPMGDRTAVSGDGFGLPQPQSGPRGRGGLNLSLPKIKLPVGEGGGGEASPHSQPRSPFGGPRSRAPIPARPGPQLSQPAAPQAPQFSPPQAPQFNPPRAPQAPQFGQPQAPQFGQPQAPRQAPQFGQPQAPQQAPQFGQPQAPQRPPQPPQPQAPQRPPQPPQPQAPQRSPQPQARPPQAPPPQRAPAPAGVPTPMGVPLNPPMPGPRQINTNQLQGRVGGGGGILRVILFVFLGLLVAGGGAAGVLFYEDILKLLNPPPPVPVGPALLSIKTDQPLLEVFDNNMFIGETPIDAELENHKAGHELKILQGRKTYAVSVPPVEGSRWIYISKPAKGLSYGIVQSAPAGAKVMTSKGKPIGQTPLIFVAPLGTSLDLSLDLDGAQKAASVTATGGNTLVKFD